MSRIQKKVWPHIRVIRMHKTNDSVDVSKEKFKDKYECFKLAEMIVNAQFAAGNKYFYLEVDTNMEKIYARISDNERDQIIEEYLGLFYNQLINPMLNMRNAMGGKAHTAQSAFAIQKQRIINTYFTVVS